MTITITQKNLFNALSMVSSTVDKNGVSEYLSSVLIKNCNEQLTFQTTNMNASTISTCQEFQGNLEKDICVRVEDFLEIIKRYKPDEELTLKIETKENAEDNLNAQLENVESALQNLLYLTLSKGDRSFAELPINEAENFPELLSIGNECDKIIFHKEDLKTAIEKTHFCIFSNESRYNINGLHFNFQSEAKKIDVVSTDGHRLAYFEIEDRDLKSDVKITIPRNIIASIKKDIEFAQNEIEFKINGGKLQINFGSHILITRLIDAEFPNYNRVIPKDCNDVIKLQKALLGQSLDRVSSIVLKSPDPRVVMSFENDKLSMSCLNDIKKSKTKEVVDCEFEGTHIFGVNALYLKECLQGVISKDLTINIKQGADNFPIKIQDGEDKRFFYVVMPMKI